MSAADPARLRRPVTCDCHAVACRRPRSLFHALTCWPATSWFVDVWMYPCVASAETRRRSEGTRCASAKPGMPGRRGVLRFPSPGEDWGRPGITIARVTTPLSDEEIRAAIVGELVEHNATIDLVEYDPEWPRLFEREAERIRDALGAKALRIEHVGSTSVPGLAAKPIIDIDLVVADSSDEDAYVPQLEAAGYVLRIREPDWFEHRLLQGAGHERQSPHVLGGLRGGRSHARLPRLAPHARRTIASSTSTRSASSRHASGSTCRTTRTRSRPSCRRSLLAR